jgi:hypothetical protein
MTGRGIRESKSLFNLTISSTYHQESPCSIRELDESTRSSDLPFFDLSIIVAATNDFSDANKLGEGGFGSVYKVQPSLKEFRNLHNFNSCVLMHQIFILDVSMHHDRIKFVL